MAFYYLSSSREAVGPFDRGTLDSLREQGVIQDETLVAAGGGSEWVRFRDLKSSSPPKVDAGPVASRESKAGPSDPRPAEAPPVAMGGSEPNHAATVVPVQPGSEVVACSKCGSTQFLEVKRFTALGRFFLTAAIVGAVVGVLTVFFCIGLFILAGTPIPLVLAFLCGRRRVLTCVHCRTEVPAMSPGIASRAVAQSCGPKVGNDGLLASAGAVGPPRANPPTAPGGEPVDAAGPSAHAGIAKAGVACGATALALSFAVVVPLVSRPAIPIVAILALAGAACSLLGLLRARKTKQNQALPVTGLALSVSSLVWAPLLLVLAFGRQAGLGTLSSWGPWADGKPAPASSATKPGGAVGRDPGMARAAIQPPGRLGEPREAGTAFAVTPEGHLVTCAHVVRNSRKVVVRVKDQEREARVVAVDEKRDLALLKIEVQGLSTLPVEGKPAGGRGDLILAFGRRFWNHRANQIEFSAGRLTGWETRSEQRLLHADIPLNPGYTGGPWVDERGAVIGVFNARLTGPSLFLGSFGISSEELRQFLAEHGVGFVPAREGGGFSSTTLISRIGPAVALVKTLDEPSTPGGWRPECPTRVWRKPLPNPMNMSIGPLSEPGRIDLSPDERTLAMARERSVDLLNAESIAARRTLSGHAGKVFQIRFSPSGACLASAGADNRVLLWGVEDGSLLRELTTPRELPFPIEPRALVFSTDGNLIATVAGVSSSAVLVWDVKSGRLLRTLDPTVEPVMGLLFIPGTHELLCCGYAQANRAASAGPPRAPRAELPPETPERREAQTMCPMSLCNADTGALLQRWPVRLGSEPGDERPDLVQQALTAKGDLLALARGGGDIYLVNFRDLSVRKRLTNHGGLCNLQFSGDQALLAVGHGSGDFGADGVALYHVESGAFVWDIVRGRHYCLTRDGRRLYVFADQPVEGDAIELWDISFLYGPAPGGVSAGR